MYRDTSTSICIATARSKHRHYTLLLADRILAHRIELCWCYTCREKLKEASCMESVNEHRNNTGCTAKCQSHCSRRKQCASILADRNKYYVLKLSLCQNQNLLFQKIIHAPHLTIHNQVSKHAKQLHPEESFILHMCHTLVLQPQILPACTQ